MTREEARLEHFKAGIAAMSTAEREALEAAMLTARAIPGGKGVSIIEQLVEMAAARARTEAKHRSDAQTDRRRRRLVGARLEGESVYRFVCSALERACSEVEARHRRGPDRGAVGL